MSEYSKALQKPTIFPMAKPGDHGKQTKGLYWQRAVAGLLLLICSAQAVRGYSGGMGSLQAPYLIASAQDLLELGQNRTDYDKHFLLIADIDLSGHSFDQAVIAASSERPRPSIHFGSYFSGTVNGNGHVIRNLTITGSTNLGLFGILGECAQIYGLGVIDANISGSLDNIGILAAYSEGRIVNSFSSGSAKGHRYVGGFVGENRGYIANCYSTGVASGADWVGGLAGSSHFGGEITNCYSTCAIDPVNADSGPSVGGLVARSSRVSNSFWDVQTSGIPNDWTEMGLTTEQMHMASTFLDVGWDFHGEAANGCRKTWLMPAGGGYPVLSVFEDNAILANCGVTIGQCALAVDINEVLWDSMARFAPTWDAVALTRITPNPATHGENETGSGDTIITVSGKIGILDANNLIGVDTQTAIICAAVDDQGNDITPQHVGTPFEVAPCWDIFPTDPRPFTIQMQLGSSQSLPALLSQIDFYVYGLYAQAIVTVDIPFAVTEGWTDIVPGLRVQVQKASAEEGKCEYLIKEDHTGLSVSDGVLYPRHEPCDSCAGSWYPGLSGKDLIYNRDMLDADGQPASFSGGSSGGSYSGDMIEVRAEGASCGRIEVIRYTIAVKPRRRLIPLTLTDIPLLGF